MGDTDPVGPGGFPLLITIFGLVLTGVVLLQSLKILRKKRHNSGTPPQTIPLWKHPAILCVAALIGYALCLDVLGFAVSTFALLSVLVYLFNLKSWPKALLTGVTGTTIFIILFGRMLNVTLPRGFDLLKELSFYLY